jgi:ABC-type lipoprotein export system ATPase subunit
MRPRARARVERYTLLVIRIKGLRKRYPGAEHDVLRGIDLEITAGDFVSLVGRSGCGKSTLLNIVGGLDTDFEGKAVVDGRNLGSLNDRDLAGYRRRTVGIVFQSYHLLDHLSCAENVALAARFARPGDHSASDERARATETLDLVGLSGSADHRPTRLSGGERQRVALARALFNRPRLLLLDEPTGNLDAATGNEILSLLGDLHAEIGLTILTATHDTAIEAAGSRILTLSESVLTDKGEDSP